MEPVLIRKDAHLIKKENENLQHMLKDGQEVYDLFKGLGVEVTPKEISDFLHGQAKQHTSTTIHNFIADKMIEKAGNPDFNGVPIKKEVMRDMIQLPTSDHILKRIKEMAPFYNFHDVNKQAKMFHADHVEIKDGQVVPADGIHEKIESKHTHYTKTQRGAEVAAKLFEFLEKAKELSDFLGKRKNGTPFLGHRHIHIPGLGARFDLLPADKHHHEMSESGDLRLINDKYRDHVLQLDFIRHQEAAYPDTTAKK